MVGELEMHIKFDTALHRMAHRLFVVPSFCVVGYQPDLATNKFEV